MTEDRYCLLRSEIDYLIGLGLIPLEKKKK